MMEAPLPGAQNSAYKLVVVFSLVGDPGGIAPTLNQAPAPLFQQPRGMPTASPPNQPNTMVYVALLRGINVSGKNKLLMADLRALCATLGWQQVETYIQSGNVRFETAAVEADKLEQALQTAIADQFGYEVPVFIRSQEHFQTALAQHPILRTQPEPNHKQIYVAFLNAIPAPERVQRVLEKDWPTEQIWIQKDQVFLHYPEGAGRSKLTNNYLEKQLEVKATTRNWRTVQKLANW